MTEQKVKFVLKSAVCCIVGFLLVPFGRAMLGEAGKEIFGTFVIFAPYIQIIGIGLWLSGCYFIATGKGYSAKWTFLGIFPLIGIIFLMLLPNKRR